MTFYVRYHTKGFPNDVVFEEVKGALHGRDALTIFCQRHADDGGPQLVILGVEDHG